MRKQHSLLHFIFGFGVGTIVGFVLRNMESTEYNTGYQPKTEVFKEEDYFTDDVIKQHYEEKAARHLAKEQLQKTVEENSERAKEAVRTQKPEFHVDHVAYREPDAHENVEVLSSEEHEVEHSETPEMHVHHIPEHDSEDCANIEIVTSEEHEAEHADVSEEVAEGTVEEIADDGVSEGLEALKEAVQDNEDC